MTTKKRLRIIYGNEGGKCFEGYFTNEIAAEMFYDKNRHKYDYMYIDYKVGFDFWEPYNY